MLDCRLLFRRLGRVAAFDAPSRYQQLCCRFAAGKRKGLFFSGTVSDFGSDRAGRTGRDRYPFRGCGFGQRLNGQRSVEVDFAMIEDGDHMYNGHLTDLYKIVGNYVIGAVQRKNRRRSAAAAVARRS